MHGRDDRLHLRDLHGGHFLPCRPAAHSAGQGKNRKEYSQRITLGPMTEGVSVDADCANPAGQPDLADRQARLRPCV